MWMLCAIFAGSEIGSREQILKHSLVVKLVLKFTNPFCADCCLLGQTIPP